MENFSREFPPIEVYRASIENEVGRLQLKRVAHEQNTRLAVNSGAQRGSVVDK
jgi:hypothetical protein